MVGKLKFGYGFDMRNPARWHKPWGDFYAETLEFIEHIEALGFEYIWLAEHHGIDDGYMPSPIVFGAGVATRTKKIRISQGVGLIPHYHPVRLAEDLAVLDILSNGRAEFGMRARDKTVRAVPSWAIFDDQFIRNYMLAGTFPGRRKPKSWTQSGYLRKADSIEALAVALGVPPSSLRETVDRFNALVRKGHDDDFGRGDRAYDRWLGDPYHQPSATLGAIERGPFYAVPVVPGDVGTYGGVVTDEHARVLRGDGTVIEGLYATGVSTASVMGRSYPGAGASIGPSFTWGYVAAKHALAASHG